MNKHTICCHWWRSFTLSTLLVASIQLKKNVKQLKRKLRPHQTHETRNYPRHWRHAIGGFLAEVQNKHFACTFCSGPNHVFGQNMMTFYRVSVFVSVSVINHVTRVSRDSRPPSSRVVRKFWIFFLNNRIKTRDKLFAILKWIRFRKWLLWIGGD